MNLLIYGAGGLALDIIDMARRMNKAKKRWDRIVLLDDINPNRQHYNPYNRGWYPQVFSILNKKPVGVTIHEVDTELDHGSVIDRREVAIHGYDTSYDVYQRILKMEIRMLEEHLSDLIVGTYQSIPMESEGNINYRRDFERICKLDLESIGTLREHIDLLRAVTFQGYNNAFFLEGDEKIFVSIKLERGGVRNRSNDSDRHFHKTNVGELIMHSVSFAGRRDAA